MSTNQLVCELLTVGQLFDGSAVHTVPIYQRNFSWRAEQIEQLISDIQDAIDDNEDGYFLGNLIVTERQSAATEFEVIDGQQRLTTLYLLLTFLGDQDASRYRPPLRYESRPRATEALWRIANETSQHAISTADPASSEDAGIHEGYNIIQQFIKQHPDLRKDAARSKFTKYLQTKVTLVRASLPDQTDLNRYFEIMNTRGQQLQQVDIVKARLMSRLPNHAQRACFAWIWEACADMNSYMQMSLTRGNTDWRTRIFGNDWSWLATSGFEELLEIRQNLGAPSTTASPGSSLSLDQTLEKYAQVGEPTPDDDEENVRYRSTIEFPAFLLHVLKIMNHEDEEQEGHLDDKHLIKRFDEAIGPNEENWVRSFAVELLKCRNLFDGFILKRQSTATNTDDGDWSLQQLLKRTSKKRSVPGYINTFSRPSQEVEEDGDVDSTTRDVLLIQSMLRVTFTSPRTMHWITHLLTFLANSDPRQVSGGQVVSLLREYARGKVQESFFGPEQPTGFDINRVVFTYLDYLLLARQSQVDHRFAFRNSIEHFYPQHPAEDQEGTQLSADCINLLGNLALVSVSANSKFSNSLPKAKADNFESTILAQSPKLKRMAEITRDDGWGDSQVRRHHDKMVALLRSDVPTTP